MASITYRQPQLNDGLAMFELVKASPPLDVNSSYLYFLQASHFANTCVVAEMDNEMVGFVSGYFRPDRKDSLFVWQVVVSQKARGQGLAKKLLEALVKNQKSRPMVRELSCTISPSNKASQGLFYSFAKQYGLHVQVSDYLQDSHFAHLGHEAEEEYLLTTPNKHNLINSIL